MSAGNDVTKIDAEIRKARAEKKLRDGQAAQGRDGQGRFVRQGQGPGTGTAPTAQDKEQAKAAKQKERDDKRRAREAARKPAHMLKVEKAALRLPTLSAEAQALFNSATVSLPANELAALSDHIVHFNRAEATKRALEQTLSIGDRVRIVSGKSAGQEGTVTKSQRIRCYVQVEGSERKPVYLFTSEVQLVSKAAQQSATG